MHDNPRVKLDLVKLIEKHGFTNSYAVIIANDILDQFDVVRPPCKECGRAW